MRPRQSDSARSSTPDGSPDRTTRLACRHAVDRPPRHHAHNTSTPLATDPDQTAIRPAEIVCQPHFIGRRIAKTSPADQPPQQQSP